MYEKFEGFAHKIGMGKRPAIVAVDFANAFTNKNSPLGSDFTNEVNASRQLLDVARTKNVPIFFTTVSYEKHYLDAGNFIKKVPALDILLEGTDWVDIDLRLGRNPDQEPLIIKKYASSFFGTSLHSLLAVAGVDTIITIGATTSGCVRATVVDGLQYGYRMIVPVECVGDRSQTAHEANLYDINTKYGDVESLENVCKYIETL
ncbi:isochorismatase family protein [Bacillus sp. B15-48]|nr:isochorismatase family protein [Bacillus sp. B15-48]